MEVQGRINDTIDFGSVTAIQHLCEPCKYKNKTTQANGVCKECEEYMCDSCFEDHKSIRACRNHVMTGSMPADRDEEITRECLKHKGGTIKYYCSKDAAVGCGDCMVEKHIGCRIEIIKDVYSQYQGSEEFLTLKTKLEKLEQVYRVLEERVSDKQEENDVLLAKALDVIQVTRKEVNKHLDILEAKAVAATNKIKHENEQALKRLEDDCKQLLKEVESLNELLDPNNFTDNEWFINAIESKKKVRDIESQNEELSGITTKTFDFSEDKQLLESIKRTTHLGTMLTKEEGLYNQVLLQLENERIELKEEEIGFLQRRRKRHEKIFAAVVYLGDSVVGTAFSFEYEFNTNPLRVKREWFNAGNWLTEVMPFCMLVKPDGKTLVAIGYEAESRYAELVKDGCEKEYYYFDDIMSQLAEIKGKLQGCLIRDKNGRCLCAKDVLTMAILCLKSNVFKYINTISSLLEHEGEFVLCVPAYVEDLQVGVEQEDLTIVSETDAASIFYQYKKPELFENQPGLKVLFIGYQDKNTYSVVHEVSGKNDIQQITPLDDIPIGRHTVLNEFESFLEDMVGENFLGTFKLSSPEAYLDLKRNITLKVLNVGNQWHGPKVTFRLPRMLLEMYKDKCGESFSKSIKSDDVTVNGDKLKISSKVYQSFYEKVIKMSLESVKTITQRIPDIGVVIMYGDFLPPTLQETVQRAFPEIKVISDHDECTGAYQIGAVIVGHTQQFVKKMK